MSEFIFAINEADLADGGKSLVEVEDRLVLIFRIGEQFFCIDDVCTHDGGTLADGNHEGYEVECPRHGARFDIRTGAALGMPAFKPTQVHECQVTEGKVFVKLS
jgi:3-phenylpropionate/trans-cinnamate dioxygenase ferredoxin component